MAGFNQRIEKLDKESIDAREKREADNIIVQVGSNVLRNGVTKKDLELKKQMDPFLRIVKIDDIKDLTANIETLKKVSDNARVHQLLQILTAEPNDEQKQEITATLAKSGHANVLEASVINIYRQKLLEQLAKENK